MFQVSPTLIHNSNLEREKSATLVLPLAC